MRRQAPFANLDGHGGAGPRRRCGHGQTVWQDGARVGTVTSGTKSPTLGTFIGMASVAAPATRTGTAVAVEIRERRLPAHVVDRPFYRRPALGASHATA